MLLFSLFGPRMDRSCSFIMSRIEIVGDYRGRGACCGGGLKEEAGVRGGEGEGWLRSIMIWVCILLLGFIII